MRKKRSNNSSADKDDDFIPTPSKKYKTFIGKVGQCSKFARESLSLSEVLLFKTLCNRHNVKQMTLRDSWDIISSTFSDDILETLNQ